MNTQVQTQMQFGELILTYTTEFVLEWNDKGSGSNRDGAYWKPVPPTGFFALGSVGVNHYGNINGSVAALCIKEAQPGERPALTDPKDFELIWKDKGSGADKDGSCWRPIAPVGYVSLGDVFVRGYDKPAVTNSEYKCLRADLAYQANIGEQIWADHGSGADKDFDSFEIITPDTYLDADKGLIAAGTFVGNNRYARPTGASVLNCLNVTLPSESREEPAAPKLTSFSPPSSSTIPQLDRTVFVPFTAISDDAKTIEWKVNNSPFYRVERYISYRTEIYDHNQTSVPQLVKETVSTGISTSKSESFSKTTGISVTAESGVKFLGAGGKVSATVSVELGWSRTTGISEFENRSLEKSINVQPESAQALWATSYELVVKREDGSQLPSKLNFEVDYFVHSEYPSGHTVRELPPRREILTETNIR